MLRRLSVVDTIIIHCADTPNGDDRFRAEDINEWHKKRGFARALEMAKLHAPALANIGYHRVIHLSGQVIIGRTLQEIGAHTENHNGTSVGICMIGRDAFSEDQWHALRELVHMLSSKLAIAEIVGHRERNAGKTCPGFDVGEWINGGMAPLDGHIVPEESIKWKT